MEYIHYGSDKFDIKKFKPIENIRFFNKPRGGLWGCESTSKFSWKDFAKSEMDTDISTYFKFRIKSNAKVLKLHTQDDFNKFHSIYRSSGDTPLKMLVAYDFERVAKDYDVIDFKVKELYYQLYGWDLDSILVLNPNVIII